MGFSDDSDNDFSDWLDGFDAESDDQGQDLSGDTAFDAEEGELDWLSSEPSGDADEASAEDEEETPGWLAGIREQEGRTADAATYLGGNVDDEDDEEAWLEGIRNQFEHGATQGLAEEGEPENDEDFMEKIRALKVGDEPVETDDEEVPVVPVEDFSAGGESAPAVEDEPASEGDSPDWVGGLPEMDPTQDGEEETPIQETPFTEDPNVTGSLPSWMENLQTTGLVMPGSEEAEEPGLEDAGYSEEEISTLFEQDDLPDWLGTDEEEITAESPQEEAAPTEETQPERVIERAELPGWLQAMKPVEAVTSAAEEEEEKGEEEAVQPTRERVGPLSGLSDVIPAEPHIIHFGSPAKVIPGFELTDVQKQYTMLLKEMVEVEQANVPAKRRGVANPQQVLRWVIAGLLLAVTFLTLWISDSFEMALPDPANIPQENLAVISMVGEMSKADRVLVAVEYQPGLSGEVEAASYSLIKHLLLQQVQLVLVSTQPVGPGMGDAFLQEIFTAEPSIATSEYFNLGYISGGAAGLLNMATDIRQVRPEIWSQPSLNGIESIADFSMVLVLTDDPDVARSWVEQVQPILDPDNSGQGVPLVMAVSAQAQPLVYPYYYTSPRQISGLIGGVTGGAYYENILGRAEAGRIWTAYNIGLVLAVLIIALGSVINLARNSLQGIGKGRS
jgi:hypothetical protein